MKFLLISIVLNTNIQTKPIAVLDSAEECRAAIAVAHKMVKVPKDKVTYMVCAELK